MRVLSGKALTTPTHHTRTRWNQPHVRRHHPSVWVKGDFPGVWHESSFKVWVLAHCTDAKITRKVIKNITESSGAYPAEIYTAMCQAKDAKVRKTYNRHAPPGRHHPPPPAATRRHPPQLATLRRPPAALAGLVPRASAAGVPTFQRAPCLRAHGGWGGC